MPLPADAIMPILQRIQADVAEVKRDVVGLKHDVAGLGSKIDRLTDRMDGFEGYFTYTMGLTLQNTADIKRMRSEIDATNSRLPENPR